MSNKNINCTHNDNGAWCKNKKVKRSLLGFGSRTCSLFYADNRMACEYQEEYRKPSLKHLSKRGGR